MGIFPNLAKTIKAEARSSLSAKGSKKAPVFVFCFFRRAARPSSPSLTTAKEKSPKEKYWQYWHSKRRERTKKE